MIFYKHIDPEKNIGLTTGKEFMVYYDEGKMWAHYNDGGRKIIAERDDRPILDRGVEEGILIKIYTVIEDQVCNHEWSNFFPSFDDHENPTGRRCSKCRKQEWFKD